MQLKGINHTEVKNCLTAKFEERLKTILKTGLNGGNKIKAINTWAIPMLTYSFGVIKWSQTDILKLETLVRTSLTRFQSHHPQSAVERIMLPREYGGRGVLNIARLHSTQKSNLRQYFLNSTSPLLRVIRAADDNFTPLQLSATELSTSEATPTDEDMIRSWKAKPIHGAHPHEVEADFIDRPASNLWLKKGKLYAETEGFMIAIQDRVVPTRGLRRAIYRENIEDRCRRCGLLGETIDHIIYGCSCLAANDYIMRHNNVAKIIHQQLAKTYGLIAEEVLYFKYQTHPVLENSAAKLFWDRSITTDVTVPATKPDIILFNKSSNTIEIFDIAVPLNRNIQTTYSTKISKYTPLAIELQQMYRASRVTITPIVISATGLVPKNLISNLEKYSSMHLLKIIQKAVILDTCSIVRQFLN